MPLHKTYGIYPDRSWKRNAVLPAYLKNHIWYNYHFRPGRALIVDGKIVHQGSFRMDELQKFVDEVISQDAEKWNPEKDTFPYE